MAAKDEPLKVKIVVYDLLPPSRFASALNFFGTGVYHSSIALAIPLGNERNATPREWAFGGHDLPKTTGVFAIPEGSAPSRMPGLRHYLEIDAGVAFGDDFEKAFGANADTTRPPGGIYATVGSKSEVTLASESMSSALQELYVDDGGESDGTQAMTQAQRRAWRIIEAMRKDPEWYGTRYSLLQRNCNFFTDELCYRLTGRRIPGWINRAAWVATSVPCLIPPGWVDEEDLQISASSSSPASGERTAAVIVPPRADQMNIGGVVRDGR